jgi:C2H2-type zinc finger
MSGSAFVPGCPIAGTSASTNSTRTSSACSRAAPARRPSSAAVAKSPAPAPRRGELAMARSRASSGDGSSESFLCPECGREFTRGAALGAHRSRAHRVAAQTANARRRRADAPARERGSLACTDTTLGSRCTQQRSGRASQLLHVALAGGQSAGPEPRARRSRKSRRSPPWFETAIRCALASPLPAGDLEAEMFATTRAQR